MWSSAVVLNVPSDGSTLCGLPVEMPHVWQRTTVPPMSATVCSAVFTGNSARVFSRVPVMASPPQGMFAPENRNTFPFSISLVPDLVTKLGTGRPHLRHGHQAERTAGERGQHDQHALSRGPFSRIVT